MKRTVTFAILAVVSLICSYRLHENIRELQPLYDAMQQHLPGAKIEYEIDEKLADAMAERGEETPEWRAYMYAIRSSLAEQRDVLDKAEWILTKRRLKGIFRFILFLATGGFGLGAIYAWRTSLSTPAPPNDIM